MHFKEAIFNRMSSLACEVTMPAKIHAVFKNTVQAKMLGFPLFNLKKLNLIKGYCQSNQINNAILFV